MERTDTHFQWTTPPAGLPFMEFSGRLNLSDLVKLKLDHVDRAVVFSPATTAADMLQTLEIIFRRMAEQQSGSAVVCAPPPGFREEGP